QVTNYIFYTITKIMNHTDTLHEIYAHMSCFSLMTVSFPNRCELSKLVENCKHFSSFIKYFELMYCYMGINQRYQEYILLLLFLLMGACCMIVIAHIVDNYLGAVLKILGVKLYMNEYVTAVVLVSFGNVMPDLIVNFMPVRMHIDLFTIFVANALATLLFSGGIICYIKSFQMYEHATVRDLLFMIFSCTFLELCIANNCFLIYAALIAVYVCYLLINIIDMSLVRHSIKTLRAQIRALSKRPPGPARNRLLGKKQQLLLKMEQENRFIIRHQSYKLRFGVTNTNTRASGRDVLDTQSLGTHAFSTRRSEPLLPAMDTNQMRYILHSPRNSKNRFLFTEFFEAIIPIDMLKWRTSGCCGRFYLILVAPLNLILTLLIPSVDFLLHKHGWSKLLNCLQIIINPFLFIAIIEGMVRKTYYRWYLLLDFTHAKWSFCVTVPLAIFVLIHARTDMPPAYHVVFTILTLSISLLLLTICATELEVISIIIGLILNLSESFISAIYRSFAQSLSDMVLNVALALEGYERMAYAAIMGSAIFNLTAGIGISCLFNPLTRGAGSSRWLLGDHGTNSYFFLLIALITMLMWVSNFNFHTRRSVAIFSIILYFIYVMYAVLVEFSFIHAFKTDSMMEPK
ncbi:CG14743, partial [Drosophila busckii]